MARARQTWLCFAAACAIGLVLSSLATGAEPTEPERLHSQLAKTEGRSNKLLAGRWQGMIRQRQWADSSGKHRVYARYLDHDADLKSVKLLVLVKTGDQQSYKEKSVPLVRLGKNEQALVRRIAVVRKEVEAALAAAPGDAAGLSTESLGESPLGSEGREGEDAAPLEPPTLQQGPEQSPQARPIAPGGKRDRNTLIDPDNAPWRTDFAAFASQLSAQQGSDGKWALAWGELKQLEAACGIAKMFAEAMQGRPRPPGSPGVFKLAFAASAAQVQLGEVMWETTLTAPIADAGAAISHDLQLPPPFSITLIPEETDAGDVSRFQPGDRVRFIGRFADLWGPGETPVFTLRVRLPDDQPSSTGNESREGYSREGDYPSGAVYPPGR